MLSKTLFLFILASNLFSETLLNDTYYVKSKNIYLSDIIKNSQKNDFLFEIAENKYSKRIKSSDLIKLLKEQTNIKDIKSSSRYVTFKLISPIDTTFIETFLKQHYLEKYKTINIKKISVTPRSYTKSIPKNYIVEIRDRNYLSKSGVISIKDKKNKKIFFNYNMEATLKVLHTKEKISRGEKISLFNTYFKTIKLDKFKAMPILEFQKDTIETARHIKANKVLTTRDVETLSLVHKNSQVSVGLYDDGLYITFIAKALQNGKLGDIITIQKSNLKRLKARVVAKNKVEIK